MSKYSWEKSQYLHEPQYMVMRGSRAGSSTGTVTKYSYSLGDEHSWNMCCCGRVQTFDSARRMLPHLWRDAAMKSSSALSASLAAHRQAYLAVLCYHLQLATSETCCQSYDEFLKFSIKQNFRRACICICTYEYIHMWLFMHVCIKVYVYIHTHIRLYTYVCMYVCVCMYVKIIAESEWTMFNSCQVSVFQLQSFFFVYHWNTTGCYLRQEKTASFLHFTRFENLNLQNLGN